MDHPKPAQNVQKKRGRPFTGADDPRRGKSGGRPRGLSAYISEKTKDGKEIADFWLDVMRGKAVVKVGDAEYPAKMKERIEAGKHLAEFGCFPKAPLELKDEDGNPLSFTINLGAAK